jgi:hypothetical protein
MEMESIAHIADRRAEDDRAVVRRYFKREVDFLREAGADRPTRTDLVGRALVHAVRIEARLPDTDRAQLGMQSVAWDIVRTKTERLIGARNNAAIARYRPYPHEISEAFAIFRVFRPYMVGKHKDRDWRIVCAKANERLNLRHLARELGMSYRNLHLRAELQIQVLAKRLCGLMPGSVPERRAA